MYPDVFRQHGMETLPPSNDDQKIVDDAIWNELVHGKFPERSRVRYNEVIARLRFAGCDCVILGCTEIPLLVRPDDCPLPTLDSTRLLAKAAVKHAIEGKPVSAAGLPRLEQTAKQ
jgi:aspartate racemase